MTVPAVPVLSGAILRSVGARYTVVFDKNLFLRKPGSGLGARSDRGGTEAKPWNAGRHRRARKPGHVRHGSNLTAFTARRIQGAVGPVAPSDWPEIC